MEMFALVEQYHGLRLGADLRAVKPGEVVVVETPRRLSREPSYGYVRAFWWLWLEDGRSVASVPPGTGDRASDILAAVCSADAVLDPDRAARLRELVDQALLRAGMAATARVHADVCFACNAALFRRHSCGTCRRLTDESLAPAEGLRLPTHCFPGGIVYGVVADGRVVSVACAHRTRVMEDLVADIGVETAPAYRRRGFAKTVVSAVVGQVAHQGGEAYYGCRPDNLGSIATARSVGFVPYGRSLVFSAPATDLGT